MDMESFNVIDIVKRVIADLDLIFHPTFPHSSTIQPSADSAADVSSGLSDQMLNKMLLSNVSSDWLKILGLFYCSHSQNLSIDNPTVAQSILPVKLSSVTFHLKFHSYWLSSFARLEVSSLRQEDELQLHVVVRAICDELSVLFNHPNTIVDSHIHLLSSLCALLTRLSTKTKYLLLDFAALTLTTISEKVK